jgi:hypothetical protein
MLTQRRKCCLVKIAHCINLKGRTWEPDERVCDGTTGSGDDAEPLVILSDDEPLSLELFCFTPDGVVPTDSTRQCNFRKTLPTTFADDTEVVAWRLQSKCGARPPLRNNPLHVR